MHMRLHINLDDEVAKQIDEIAGARKRSSYIREAIEAKLEVDRRVAARRRLVGAYPDFAPWMTAEWISENRKREDEERQKQLDKYWRREEE
jgi:hypothetical protein